MAEIEVEAVDPEIAIASHTRISTYDLCLGAHRCTECPPVRANRNGLVAIADIYNMYCFRLVKQTDAHSHLFVFVDSI